jgi:hypothetical protein
MQGAALAATKRPEDDESHTRGDLHLLPLLAAKKRDLVSITDLKVPGSSTVRLLSHDEHVHVSKLMLRCLAVIAFADWFADAVGEDAKADLLAKLDQIVDLPAEDADEVVDELFEDQRLKAYQSDHRPIYEVNLYHLCRVLATRYLIIAKTYPTNPAQCSVSWNVAEANQPLWNLDASIKPQGWWKRSIDRGGQWLRRALGDNPKQVRLKAPLARRTNDYHLKINAPTGHYCFEAVALRSPLSTVTSSRPKAVLPTFTGTKTNHPAFAASRGARSEAHVFIGNGIRSRDAWLDVEVTWQEVPLGSVGAVTIAAYLTAIPALVLFVGRYAGKTDNVPANFVLVALTAGLAPALGMVLTPSVKPALWARALLLWLAATTMVFSTWWAFSPVGTRFDAGSTGALVFGAFSATSFIAIVGTATWRLLKSIWNYRSTLMELTFGGGNA